MAKKPPLSPVRQRSRLREADSCLEECLSRSLIPRRELHVSDAAGTGSAVLLPGPRRLSVLSNHTPFPYSASTCPSRNNVTPCYCSSMSQSKTIHDTKSLVWENIIVILEQNGKRGLAEEQRHTLSLSEPQPCSNVVSSYRSSLLPPPWARGARPNDGKVIHHWSTTAANWISPPPINMQSGLAKVSRKGCGGCGGEWVKVGRGVRGWG